MDTVEKSVGTTSPESARKSVRKYSANPANKAKLRAKWRIQSAKRSGKKTAPKSCPKCGRSGVRILFHHTDETYKKGNELKGKWLCDKCHGQTANRSGATASKNAKKRESMK